MADEHDKLVEKRGNDYGESYQLTDQFLRAHWDEIAAMPSPTAYIMMYFKLMRALTSPTKRDHYDDVIGYAKLELRALETQQPPATHWLIAREEEVREMAMRGDLDPDAAWARWRKEHRVQA